VVSFELSTISLFNFHVYEWGQEPTHSANLDGRNFVGGPNKGKGGVALKASNSFKFLNWRPFYCWLGSCS
jgi:hypothetical protein